MATLTCKKRENFGPVIRENIIAKNLFNCCSVKNSTAKISVYTVLRSGNWKLKAETGNGKLKLETKTEKPNITILQGFVIAMAISTLCELPQLHSNKFTNVAQFMNL